MKNTYVSYFKNVKSTKTLQNKSLFELCTTVCYKEQIENLRTFKKGSKEYKEIKESLPCFTPSVQCTYRNTNSITQYSGYICLDFDNISNTEDFKNKLSKYFFIEFCATSCSGNGVYAMIKVEKAELHKQYYEALAKFFKEDGIEIDPACKDLVRLRIVSYDPNYYYNEKATMWTDTLTPIKTTPLLIKPMKSDGFYEKLIYTIRDYVVSHNIDITSGRNYWLSTGTYIMKILGADTGKIVFRDISMFHPHFNEKEFEQCWRTICSSNRTSNLGVLLNACKRAGVPYVNELCKAK